MPDQEKEPRAAAPPQPRAAAPPHPQQSMPKEGGYGWFVVLAAFLSNATGFGILYSFTILFPDIVADFQAGQGIVSFIGSLAAAIMLVVGAVVGRLADRFGPRAAVGMGTLMLTGGLAAASMSNHIWQVFLTFGVVGGFGLALTFLPAVSAVGQWFTRRRGLATGLAVAGSGVGTIVMAPIAQSLVSSTGWRGAARAIAAIGFVTLAVATVLVKGRVPSQRGGVAKQMFRNRTFLKLYASAFVASYGYWIPFIFIVPYTREENIAPAFAAMLVSAMGGANTVGRVVLGGLADRVGRLRIFQFALLSMGASTLLWPLTGSTAGLIVFASFYGFVAGTFISLLFALTADYFGVERLAGTVGLLNTGAALGTLIGPPITGAMFDTLGSYTVPLLIGGATLILGGIICLTLPQPNRIDVARSPTGPT